MSRPDVGHLSRVVVLVGGHAGTTGTVTATDGRCVTVKLDHPEPGITTGDEVGYDRDEVKELDR